MNVAFYLPNKFCAVSCTCVEQGNPGMGGTEYMIIALAYYLSINQNTHSITLLAQKEAGLPSKCHVIEVADVVDALSVCKRLGMECLVAQNSLETNRMFNEDLGSLKLVMWAHSFMSRHQWNLYAKSANVKRVVCVGYEELELYYDHKAYRKSTVIYNAFPFPSTLPAYVPFSERAHEVTFLASIVPHTHFHLLAKIWKEVVRQVPDAHLNVIGSGNLYNNAKALGKYKIAQVEYENKFMSYLLDKDGVLLPSVTFWGKLGNEKYNILKKTKVGVANPGGYETFCISAVEMQLYGAKVISCRKGGLLDTVYNSENLFLEERDLAAYIINALTDNQYDYAKTFSFLRDNFSFKTVCQQWIELFNDVEHDVPQTPLLLSSKSPTTWHRFRHFNKIAKSIIPFGHYWLPSAMFYGTIYQRIKQLFVCEH